MWDIHERRITNERERRTVANSPTMESMMEVRRCRWLCKLSFMKASRSPRLTLGAWCPTPRPVGRPQQTIRHAYVSTLKILGFVGDRGQLREWMTVARDRSAWVLLVEDKLDLPSRLIHESPQTMNEHDRQMTILTKLAFRPSINGKKTTTTTKKILVVPTVACKNFKSHVFASRGTTDQGT
jgi:hypothetical protein